MAGNTRSHAVIIALGDEATLHCGLKNVRSAPVSTRRGKDGPAQQNSEEFMSAMNPENVQKVVEVLN